MAVTFTTHLKKDMSINASGISIPPALIDELGAGKKPKVTANVNGYVYRTTVAVMGGEFLIPVSQAIRAEAGFTPGQEVVVTLEIDSESRKVDLPDDLKAALSASAGALEEFDKLADSKRKEFVRQVTEAKAEETRERRIAGIVAKMGAS